MISIQGTALKYYMNTRTHDVQLGNVHPGLEWQDITEREYHMLAAKQTEGPKLDIVSGCPGSWQVTEAHSCEVCGFVFTNKGGFRLPPPHQKQTGS